MPNDGYKRRLVDGLIEELFEELPALMLTGPRAAGKTTTAARHVKSVVSLARPAEASAFAADPDAVLAGYEEPILLDEWQEVPAILGAVKRAVDDAPGPGRFLLTGSVRADLDASTWPGTGRVVRIPMYGMTVGELRGLTASAPFVDRLAAEEIPTNPSDPPDVRGYVDLALGGGFPDAALRMTTRGRTHWLEGYVEQLLTRDATNVEPRRDPERLRRYFEAYALNSAGTVSDATLLRAAGIDARTAVAYERLLSNLFAVERVPAWSSNRLRRLSKGVKRYIVDPALLAAALGLDSEAVLRDGDLLGRLLDTFVAAHLRAERPACGTLPRLYHLREEHGRHEIDLVAELGGQTLLAFEVKATAAPTSHDARHLIWLRNRLGERFLHGVLFHTGPRPFRLSERVSALPICSLWE